MMAPPMDIGRLDVEDERAFSGETQEGLQVHRRHDTGQSPLELHNVGVNILDGVPPVV